MLVKPVSNSKTTITELMIPAYANFGGKVHGGILLSLMDKVAFACASKHSGNYCVTVSVDEVEFKEPVEVGELVSLYASVDYVGNSSMMVGIRVESLQPKTGIIKHTNSCYFTMVAKCEDGKLAQVPKLKLETTDEVQRFAEAKALRKLRLKIHDMLHSELKHATIMKLTEEIKEDRCVIE